MTVTVPKSTVDEMSRRGDYISCATILVAFCLFFGGAWGVLPTATTLVCYMIAIRWVGLVQHNHIHRNTVGVPILDRLLDLTLSVMTGVPCQLYWIHHVRIHHVNLDPSLDSTGPDHGWLGRIKSQRLRTVLYIVTFIPLAWLHVLRLLLRRYPSRRSWLICELGAMLTVWTVVAWHSGWSGLVFVVFPVLATYIALPINNRRHHLKCDLMNNNPLLSCNNSNKALDTRFGFNIGFHSAHHSRPRAHWTRLPEVDQQLRAEPTKASQRSL